MCNPTLHIEMQTCKQAENKNNGNKEEEEQIANLHHQNKIYIKLSNIDNSHYVQQITKDIN